ncbi:hypothetical protein [Nocardioides sp.]|uniref:hypothetical protein n=1 Tax=Nocardioides sp. TaxID=35761 RepID=UPI0027288D75|nr:hypothetical protein [Nocardioides sp.]MDO9455158.1 hypothetical protein [Nocardioides sp.]
MPATDLADLLDRAALNDTVAFAAFYDLTVADAYRLAQLSVDPARVDDLVHDAYLNAWLDSASYALTGFSARAWLMILVQLNVSPEPVGGGHVFAT